MRELTKAQFLKDVAGHKMKVLRNDGLYKHLHFEDEIKGYNLWFDLITWPGNLTIRGDMGTWTFSRIQDMFNFFRSPDLSINAGYWAEKLQGGIHGGRDLAKRFDEDSFKKRLVEQLEDYYGLHRKKLAEVKQALQEEVLNQDCKYDLMIAARDFQYTFSDGKKFQFETCELPDGKEYTYQFIWCLYAIVWGIQQWDAAQAVKE